MGSPYKTGVETALDETMVSQVEGMLGLWMHSRH